MHENTSGLELQADKMYQGGKEHQHTEERDRTPYPKIQAKHYRGCEFLERQEDPI